MSGSWEVVIGLEVHAQLATSSKIFSGASTAYGAEPNTQACLVDLGYPGVLPVLNKEVVRMAAKFGLAVNATVAPRSEKYTEGDMCKLTKAPREATVHYICGQTDQLQRVEEPAPCIYELHATVRAACEPAEETGERGWHQLLLFSPLEYRSQ